MDQEPPLSDDPYVNRLLENIRVMADRINLDFIPDPEKVRQFTVAWAKSLERSRAELAQSRTHRTD